MRRILFTLLLLFSTSGLTAAYGGTSSAQADELMDVSGMSAQVDDIPLMIGMTLQQQQAQLQMPDWQLQTLSDALEAGFDPQPMKSDIRGHLESNLDPADAEEALAWLESPLGQRATELEGRTGLPAVQQEIMQRLQSGAGEPLSEARQALIERFDEATGASEMSVEMVVGIQRGLLTAILRAAGAPAEQLDAALGQVAAARAQIQAAVEARNKATFAVVYRDLSDAEMTQYVEFAESESGRAYHQAMLQGFAKAMEAAAKRSGEAMAAADQ